MKMDFLINTMSKIRMGEGGVLFYLLNDPLTEFLSELHDNKHDIDLLRC